MSQPVRASELVEEGCVEGLVAEAKEAINLYLKPGLGAEGSVQAYNDTNSKYDQVGVTFTSTLP